MGGILSTYANFGRGDYVQGGFGPDTIDTQCSEMQCKTSMGRLRKG